MSLFSGFVFVSFLDGLCLGCFDRLVLFNVLWC